MSTRSLPARPSLVQLKVQANELLAAHRHRQPSAAARIIAHHPKFTGLAIEAAVDASFALADAQLVIAREYGFDTWAALKHYVELSGAVADLQPHPRFDEAVAAMDEGDVQHLRTLLQSDPSLAHARTNLSPPYHYFTGATLLHHVAGNPDRGRLAGKLPPLPANSAEIARALLEAGADVNALTLGPNGGDIMGLVVTSFQASEADVSGVLIDVLLEFGATLDLTSDDCLDASLANHAPRAAEKMIALGATADVLAAAALGRMDLLRACFDAAGRLLVLPRRAGKELRARDAIGLALLYAYVRGQRDAVDWLLEKDGNWNMIGVNNGTALHRAASAGDLEMIKRLVARGADINNRDNPFAATPLSWAIHGQQPEVARWIVDNCALDLHDAVTYDVRSQVNARLQEDPAAVHTRVDEGEVPHATALHVAARLNRVALAKLLLEHGADPNAIAGNGMTALDLADAESALATIAMLEQRGAMRTSKAPPVRATPAPPYRLDIDRGRIEVRPWLDAQDWDAILQVMADRKITALSAGGQMTDAVLARVVELQHVTQLELHGSKELTDSGLQVLARLPELRYLDVGQTELTDRGLEVLRRLQDLRTLLINGQRRISDNGVAHMVDCEALERVSLLGTSTGDGAIRALGEKGQLRHFAGGAATTTAGFALLHAIPAFKTWQGGVRKYGLMDYDAGPTYVKFDGTGRFDRGALAPFEGLDGLFALNLDNPVWRGVALAPLARLANLGVLGHGADDDAMRQIGGLPGIRMLMAQDTEAGDAGFEALSRSPSIEYLWGRRCYNLTGRGFAALATMPSLRGLSVSCRNVDDAGLATLSQFPALREFMPMDVPDAGFRHVARCENLEALWCMYCRDTTDKATEQIASLPKLRTYYAGQTLITDRSLEMLSRMQTLENLTFWNVAGISDAGVTTLAALPHLREISIESCRQVTPDIAARFPDRVRVKYSA